MTVRKPTHLSDMIIQLLLPCPVFNFKFTDPVTLIQQAPFFRKYSSPVLSTRGGIYMMGGIMILWR